uniref:Uncharacterized protein n=1 Tax=Rhizophora mucronata TaxID=61149 RepID=A0A2P2QRQ0_RHIMU
MRLPNYEILTPYSTTKMYCKLNSKKSVPSATKVDKYYWHIIFT